MITVSLQAVKTRLTLKSNEDVGPYAVKCAVGFRAIQQAGW